MRVLGQNTGGSCHVAQYRHRSIGPQNDSTPTIARFLEARPAIERVFYPGLASQPGHDIAPNPRSIYHPVPDR
ncbi:PLP-dependent transferase [Desulfosarcina sp.]|uniref:PLP-dependent transferase n=1 Tax=Desulfosarcina sp. TaxID=2027861 RepID=UPI003563093C